MKKLLPFLLSFVLAGCPIRTDPPTSAVCSSKPNCGQCASLPVCVWCASADPAERGCRPASEAGACVEGEFASAEPLCPTDERGRR